MSEKSQLGDFCTQFGIEGPSSSKPKTGQTEGRHHKNVIVQNDTNKRKKKIKLIERQQGLPKISLKEI